MRISWVGMPTSKDARKTAEAWLERKPPGVNITRKLDPSADLRLVFNLRKLGSGGVDLLGRKRFSRKSIIFIDSYLDGAGRRGAWLVKMVRMLLFVSRAESAMFARLYPDVRTTRRILPIVIASEHKEPRKKRTKRKILSEEEKTTPESGSAAREQSEMEPFEAPSAEEKPKPEKPKKTELAKAYDRSAKNFWKLVLRIARAR